MRKWSASVPTRAPRKSSRSARLLLESLEERVVPTTAPFVFNVLDESGLGPTDPAGHTLVSAQSLPVAAMMESRVVDSLWTTGTSDLFAVNLRQNQFVTLSAHAQAGTADVSTNLTLLDATGTPLAQSADAVNSSLGMRTLADGTYYVALAATDNTVDAPASFTLAVRPVGLDNTRTDPAFLHTWLRQSGGATTVWLDNGTLDVVGSAGRGFGIRGDWQQQNFTSGGLTASTYTAAGTVYLETAAGEVPVTLAGGTNLVINTQASQFGDVFGEVDTFQMTGSVDLAALGASFDGSTAFGLAMTGSTGDVTWNLALGNAAGLRGTGAPTNAAMPYLYASTTAAGAAASFGGRTAPADAGTALALAIDPADSLYVGGRDTTGHAFAFGGSLAGLTGFTPTIAGANALDGHLFVRGVIDFNPAHLPLAVDGETTFNLDPTGTGTLLGGGTLTASQLLGLLRDPSQIDAAAAAQIDAAFAGLSFGSNGPTTVTYTAAGFNQNVSFRQASTYYDGPSQTATVSGQGVDATALIGTPLGRLVRDGSGMSGLGTVGRDGSYNLRLTGNLQSLLFPLGNGSITLTNAGAAVHGVLQTGGLLPDVPLDGTLFATGDYSLSGAVPITLGPVNGPATFTLHNTGASEALDLSGTLQSPLGPVYLSGGISPDGGINLVGTLPVNYAPLLSGSATMTLTLQGAALVVLVSGEFTTPVGPIHLSGNVQLNGDYTLTGVADIAIGPVSGPLTVTVTSTHGAMTYTGNGTFNTPVGTFVLTGGFQANGDYSFTGTAPVTIGPVSGSLTLTVSRTGGVIAVSGNGTMTTPVGTFGLSGGFQTNGDFSLTGTAPVTIGPVSGPMTLTVSRTGGVIAVGGSGTLTTAIGTFALSGNFDTAGNFSFTGSAPITLGAVNGTTTLTVARQTGVLTVHGSGSFNTPIGVFGLAGDLFADGGFSLTGSVSNVSIGAASGSATITVSRQGSSGGLAVHGTGRVATPIGTFDIGGDFQPNGNFTLTGQSVVSLSGATGNAGLTISRTNGVLSLSVSGPAFTTPIGSFNLSGGILPDGHFTFTGSGSASIGVVSGNATLTVSNTSGSITGSVHGSFTSPLAAFTLDGSLLASGDFTLSGTAAVPFGPVSGNATLTVSKRASVVTVHVDGTVYTAVGTFGVNGDIATNGNFHFAGSATVTVGPVGGNGTLSVDKAGSTVTAGVDATVNVASVGSFRITGNLQPAGNFTLTGTATVTIGPVGGGFTLTTTKTGSAVTVHLDGSVGVASVGTFHLLGDVQSNGNFTLTGSAGVTIGPVGGNGSLNVTKSGSSVTGGLDLTVGVTSVGNFHVTGTLLTGGNFTLTGGANVTIGPVNGGFTLTVGKTGSAVTVHLDGSAGVNGAGSIHVGGDVQSNANFSLTGSGGLTLGPVGGNFSLTVAKNGGSVTGSLGGSVNTPIGSFGINGSLGTGGNFTLGGSATVRLGGFNFGASLTVAHTGSTWSVTSHIGGSVTFADIRGSVGVDFRFTGSPGSWSVSGSGSANVDVYVPWPFSSWEHVGGVDLSVSNHSFGCGFSFLGFHFGFSISF